MPDAAVTRVERWLDEHVPSQEGKTAVVTGANSGLGLETAARLAGRKARVIMACRNPDKAAKAAEQIRSRVPGAELDIMQLDVASLDSIRQFADACLQQHPAIDMLINNAGVMGCPTRESTADGFEKQFGTNHLGAFALTGRLLPALEAAGKARIIAVASVAHRNTRGLNLDDPNFERTAYKPFDAYAKSKLANLLFMHELNKRFKTRGSGMKAAAAHPGYSASNIGSGANPTNNPIKTLFFQLGNLIAMPVEKGALPTLYAATSDKIRGGEYIGPTGLLGFWGWPEKATPEPTATDDETARRLWEISEQLTGVSYLSAVLT